MVILLPIWVLATNILGLLWCSDSDDVDSACHGKIVTIKASHICVVGMCRNVISAILIHSADACQHKGVVKLSVIASKLYDVTYLQTRKHGFLTEWSGTLIGGHEVVKIINTRP